MANLRPMLFMGLLVLSYMMWVEWQKDYGTPPASQQATEVANLSSETPTLPAPGDSSIPSAGDLPTADSGTANTGLEPTSQAVMTGASGLLVVTTDVLEVGIDLLGGTLVSA
jgi:YidC/Oxa1 family membrane protein insertase